MDEQASSQSPAPASGLAFTLAGVQGISLLVLLAISMLVSRALAGAAPDSALAHTLTPLRLGLWGATALNGLIALAIYVLLRERIVRPIRDFGAALHALARGEAPHGLRRAAGELAPLQAAYDALLAAFTERHVDRDAASDAQDVEALCRLALRDPSGYADFKRDAGERLYRACQGESALLELHTVEACAAAVGCETFARSVQDCQARLRQKARDSRPVRDLSDRFRELCGRAQKASGGSEFDYVVVRRQEYHQLLSLLHVRDAQYLTRARLLARSWSMHRVGATFERLAKASVRSAEQQGKALCVQIAGESICLAKGELDELWSALPHLMRNAIAHGIEPSAERIANGKPAEGRIELRAEVERGELRLSVADDGRGFERRAFSEQAPSEGVSTTSALADLAGRGVGLSAVRRIVTQLGGSLDVRSQPGAGTTIEIRAPAGDDVYVPASAVVSSPNYHSRMPAARARAAS